MNIAQLLNYLQYSKVCPDRINPIRWKAILVWVNKRGYISEK